jgi:pSer/pThr/pTyr-binding forkhead associated (FHA) protein
MVLSRRTERATTISGFIHFGEGEPLSVQDGIERRAELMLEGPGLEGTVRLTTGSTYVGKGQDATIRFADDTLEDRHLEIDWDGTELWLIHLGKGSRPLVNGQLSAEAQLQSGDRVEIGEHGFRVRILRRSRPGGAPVSANVPAQAELSPAETAGESVSAQAPARPLSPDEQVILEFSVHLLKEQPRKAAVIGIGLLAFFSLLWFVIIPGQTTLVMIAMFILIATVGAFIFPLYYRLTEAGVEIRGFPLRDRKRWSRFASHVEYPDAVQLLLSQKDIRGRVLKGSLVYYGEHKDRVMEIVRERVPKGVVAPLKPVKKGKAGS